MPNHNVIIAALAATVIFTPAMAFAGPGGAGHSHGPSAETAYGKPGDPKKPTRTVAVTMREVDGKMLFFPNVVEVKRGEQIRFSMKNTGALDHELVVATLEENLKHAIEMQKNPDMEHDDPNAKRLAPGKAGEIVWHFTKAGEFDFSCLIPGHREAGMSGKIVVR